MRFPIDAVFLDADQVVIKIEHEVGPWRTVSCRGAREVVELPAGESRRRGLEVGDRVAWASRSAADARVDRGAVTYDGGDDEPRARVLVASSDPRFLRLARFLLGGRDFEVEELDDARAPPGCRARAEHRHRRARRRRQRWPTHSAPQTQRARVDPRSPWSSPRTLAARARPACVCSIAGTRPRSSSKTSSASSPTASRERLLRHGAEPMRGDRDMAGELHSCGKPRR